MGESLAFSPASGRTKCPMLPSTPCISTRNVSLVKNRSGLEKKRQFQLDIVLFVEAISSTMRQPMCLESSRAWQLRSLQSNEREREGEGGRSTQSLFLKRPMCNVAYDTKYMCLYLVLLLDR